jgi:hypothetical protein
LRGCFLRLNAVGVLFRIHCLRKVDEFTSLLTLQINIAMTNFISNRGQDVDLNMIETILIVEIAEKLKNWTAWWI